MHPFKIYLAGSGIGEGGGFFDIAPPER